MAALNPLTRELVFKIVFYGPGLGGKTTTLQYIHAATKAEHRGQMVSLATPTDRTLYFDYLPIRVPRVRGMGVRLQLFTVPGQVYYAATRKLVLSGADGVVFVADSQEARLEANRESLEDLHDNLLEHDRRLSDVPHTFHWNKRDLDGLVPVEELEKAFNPGGAPSLSTVATNGDGVFPGLERITRLVLRAYEADLPRSEATPGGFAATEMGIEDAIRSLTAPAAVRTPTEGLRNPTIPWSPQLMAKVLGSAGAPPPAATIAEDKTDRTAPDSKQAAAPREAAREDAFDMSSVALRVQPQVPRIEAPSALLASSPGFSLSDMWPESERESVRHAEALLAAADATNAILACDVLGMRVLASAAALAGTTEAPRDPGLVALLLGLNGTRFLAFRAAVRAARAGQPVGMRQAYECYAFALEARSARAAVPRG